MTKKKQAKLSQKLKGRNLVAKDKRQVRMKKNEKRQIYLGDNEEEPVKRAKVSEEFENKQEAEIHQIPCPLRKESMLKVVKALRHIVLQNACKMEKKLFDDEECRECIQLYVHCMKLPLFPENEIPVPMCISVDLPYGLVDKFTDVLLVVPSHREWSCSETIEHYKSHLNNEGVLGLVTEVMDFRTVTGTYGESEGKRRLCSRFDVILSEASIQERLTGVLGNRFLDRNRIVTPVVLKENVRENLIKALNVSHHYWKLMDSRTVIKVGRMSHTDEQIVANLEAILKQFVQEYPGGWDNILSLDLSVSKLGGAPLYISLKSRNSVKDIEQPMKQPVEYVSGELVGPGTACHVIVDNFGNVSVIPDAEDADSDEESKLEKDELLDEDEGIEAEDMSDHSYRKASRTSKGDGVKILKDKSDWQNIEVKSESEGEDVDGSDSKVSSLAVRELAHMRKRWSDLNQQGKNSTGRNEGRVVDQEGDDSEGEVSGDDKRSEEISEESDDDEEEVEEEDLSNGMESEEEWS